MYSIIYIFGNMSMEMLYLSFGIDFSYATCSSFPPPFFFTPWIYVQASTGSARQPLVEFYL
jgi:hypothetical protein